MKDKNYKLY